MPEQILIVDKEPNTIEVVRSNLEKTGFQVTTTGDAETAFNLVQEQIPDLILLDPMSQGLDGFSLCKQLKQETRTQHVPICVVSKQDDETNRILAFELGVDDYLKKPFSLRELLLRIRIILKRKQNPPHPPKDRLTFGPLIINPASHEIFVKNSQVPLTVIEFKLLLTLMERKGRVQSRDDLLNAVWGYEHQGNGRMVDAHIRRMRAKLGQAQTMIRTIRGIGYCFRPDLLDLP